MTPEQIDKKIKELQELKKKAQKEQKQKEALKIKKERDKNNKKIAELVRLLHTQKTDQEIIDMYYKNIKEKQPQNTTAANKVLGIKELEATEE